MISKVSKRMIISLLFAFFIFNLFSLNKAFSSDKNIYKITSIQSLFGSNVEYEASVGFHKNNPIFAVKKKSNGYICIVEYSLSTKKYTVLLEKKNFSYITVSPDKSKIAYMYCNNLKVKYNNFPDRTKLKVNIGIIDMDSKKLIKEFTTDYNTTDGQEFGTSPDYGICDYTSKFGIKWSSQEKNISFLELNTNIVIYNISTGNKKIFEPYNLKLDSPLTALRDYQIDDSTNSIYMCGKNMLSISKIYQVSYDTYEYKVLEDLSHDRALPTYFYNGFDSTYFEIGNLSFLDSTGFYFSSGDCESNQLWKYTKKTGKAEIIRNIAISTAQYGNISLDANLLIIFSDSSEHDPQYTTSYIYLIGDNNKYIISCNVINPPKSSNCYFISDNKQFLIILNSIYTIK